ncbi:MAG: NUDIX domain-containing protein [Woeseia sp.]|nr:NUDIX domain-containing protein [Woeseia sp.]
MSDAEQGSAPRQSATVVLLRDGTRGPEVLLVLRHARASFGASYVFPGGVKEDCDAQVHERCYGTTDEIASRKLGVNTGGLSFYSAAIRELFEETGILLAHRAGNGDELVQVTDNDCDAERNELNNGDLLWPDFLADRQLSLACDALHYFAFWVTPRVSRKRFSTRFFMAAMPCGQLACHDGAELTDSCWMRPKDALAAAAVDEMLLPPPTRKTLQELSGFTSVAGALGWAGEQESAGVGCILPAILGPRNEQRIVLPGNPDYPADHRGQEA